MLERLRELIADVGRAMRRFFYRVTNALSAARVTIIALALFLVAGYAMYQHPPVKTVARGELGIRYNRLTGTLDEWREGSALVLPGLHDAGVTRRAGRQAHAAKRAARQNCIKSLATATWPEKNLRVSTA